MDVHTYLANVKAQARAAGHAIPPDIDSPAVKDAITVLADTLNRFPLTPSERRVVAMLLMAYIVMDEP